MEQDEKGRYKAMAQSVSSLLKDEVDSDKFLRLPWAFPPMETIPCRVILPLENATSIRWKVISPNHPPYCEDCIVPLTVLHLLTECPKFENLRERHLKDHRREKGGYNASPILTEGNCGNEEGTYLFILEAGLLKEL